MNLLIKKNEKFVYYVCAETKASSIWIKIGNVKFIDR